MVVPVKTMNTMGIRIPGVKEGNVYCLFLFCGKCPGGRLPAPIAPVIEPTARQMDGFPG